MPKISSMTSVTVFGVLASLIAAHAAEWPAQLPVKAPVHVFILLGGLVGSDGFVTSAGMYGLANQLRQRPGVTVDVYPWTEYARAERGALEAGKTERVVVVGFSGGGAGATWLASDKLRPRVDLMVLYDPSPSWRMKPVYDNVRKAVVYHNNTPLMGGLGGGRLAGENVTTYEVYEQHLLVQGDQRLHRMTLAAVDKLRVACTTDLARSDQFGKSASSPAFGGRPDTVPTSSGSANDQDKCKVF